MTESKIPPLYSIIVPPIAVPKPDLPYQALSVHQSQVIERQKRLIDSQTDELTALHRIIVALVMQSPDGELEIHDATLERMEGVRIHTMHDGTRNVSRITIQ